MPHNPFYWSKQWRDLRLKYIRQNPHCVFCLMVGFKTIATEVDHITAIENGGLPLSENNLRSACKMHHSQKTFMLDAKRGNRAFVVTGPDGLPIHVEGKRDGNATKPQTAETWTKVREVKIFSDEESTGVEKNRCSKKGAPPDFA